MSTTSPPPSDRPDRGRDSARAGVYAGENQVARMLDRSVEFPVVEVAGSRIVLPPERHFGDLAGVQRYVDAVLTLPWVARRWPRPASVPVTVRERRGATRAHYEFERSGTATIAVPVRGAESRWALRELVVLHEIAHHLASDAGGRQGRRDGGSGPPSGARSEQSSTASDAGGRQGRRDGGSGRRSSPPLRPTLAGARVDLPSGFVASGVAGPPSGARSEQSSTASDADTGHGPGFTGCMLELAGGVMGDEIALLLRVAWADQGVSVG